ncbi:MAG: helix-turn-helix domain-containing protein [Lachnospiraceae bacterium]|nr:helix-turn-helix domain-containing protein [Lachnospiraceae bacterium]
MISYEPLWKTMEKKEISQYFLLKSGIDNKTLDSLKKNKNITLLTVERLCNILDCQPNDIVEFTKKE